MASRFLERHRRVATARRAAKGVESPHKVTPRQRLRNAWHTVTRPARFLKAHSYAFGRAGILILALAICMLPPFLISNAIGYVPLLALVLIVIISYAYLCVLRRSLEFSEESLLDSCERGTDVEFVVHFKNKSPLVFVRLEPYIYISDLFGGLDVVIPASMPLMPFEERDFRFNAQFDHIGEYSAGVDKVVISDLLGLFRHTINNDSRHTVEVLPKIFDVMRVDLSNVSVQESTKAFQPIVIDDMDYAGVREYAWGDPIKTIHWKLSSRSADGTYYTRLFEAFGNPGITIVLDTTSPAYTADELMSVFDGVVESALSVNEYAINNGIDSEIIYLDKYGERKVLRMVTSVDSLVLIREVPRIQVAPVDNTLNLLNKECNSIYAQGNIAFCTAHIDEHIVSTLLDVKRRKRNPVLFLVVPRGLSKDEEKAFLMPLRRLDSAQIVYYVVSSAADLGKEVPQHD